MNHKIDIPDPLPNQIQVSRTKFQKMVFIMNALENGWTVQKTGDSYVFTKKHENRREIYQEKYLEDFVVQNASQIDILSK